MTYRELLSLYKNGKLSEEKRAELEAEIEKQDAISEYLFDEAEIPDFSAEDTTELTGDDALALTIRRSIRKAFVKTGLIMGAVVLTIVLLVIFALPKLVSLAYYDPTEIVAQSEIGKTDRMSLDMAVYSEMFLPGHYRGAVTADPRGYGVYDINILQTSSVDGRFTNVSGKLERGKLVLYDSNTLRLPTGNAFIPAGVGEMGEGHYGPAGTKTEAYAALNELNKEQYYVGYISMADVMTYEDFSRWLRELSPEYGNLWCRVETKNCGNVCSIGFAPENSGMVLEWDRETYPELSLLGSVYGHEYSSEEELMRTHFVSMLRYLKDHGDILEMMGLSFSECELDAIIEDAESGLMICGFSVTAKPDALILLSQDTAVSYIYTTPLY